MAKAWGCGVKFKESHLFPQPNGNASPTREVMGRKNGGSGQVSDDAPHIGIFYPPAFGPWSILNFCITV